MRPHILALLLLAFASSASARVWRVEKDGSGDFTVIQDALDATAPGDSVVVGPGRFEEFRPGASTVSGAPFQAIAWLTTDDVTILGSGVGNTIIGPTSLVAEIGGLVTASFYIDGGSTAQVKGFSVESSHYLVVLRRSTMLANCKLNHTSTEFGTRLVSGSQIEIRNCEFLGANSLATSSAAVTHPKIVDCRFQDDLQNGFAIAIGNGATDALISNCQIVGFAVGIQTSLGATATIEDTTFSQALVSAIDVSSGAITMRRCRIAPGARFPLRVNNGRLDVYDSVIGGGQLATVLVWGDMLVRNSHIMNGGALSVDSGGSASRLVDLADNWWGTTDLQQIDDWISELNPNVIYLPILGAPISTRTESFAEFKSRFAAPALDGGN